LPGHLAGVAVIGYADKPGKTQALADVQAAAVTTDLAEITTALRDTPRPALRIEPRTFSFFLIVVAERPSSPFASQSRAACRTV